MMSSRMQYSDPPHTPAASSSSKNELFAFDDEEDTTSSYPVTEVIQYLKSRLLWLTQGTLLFRCMLGKQLYSYKKDEEERHIVE
ncbi:hypothetical protein N1851_009072 [Merluccius polli]|uniref:Uncharacterized protein n=1 Tax=Merluccius polli TaxID=89951 RepID=A0AA47N1Y5_MERPO|nr:hypothetical protein N1851_009072 [Merluccius polli]